jgi:hypothetical protein
MNKYKWLIGLTFISLIVTSLQATTIAFNSPGGHAFVELEDSAVPSLTYDGLLDLLLKNLDKPEKTTNYSKINKSNFLVIFKGKNLAHPHNFLKWKENPFSERMSLLLTQPKENSRRVWFWDKVYHPESWANHCHKLDLPDDASVQKIKQMLLEKLGLESSISLNDIKLFGSYESETELSEVDLQNESILNQGISFSFDSIEKEISVELKNAPAAIEAFYPNGFPIKVKQYYTTENDVRYQVAQVLDIELNDNVLNTLKVKLNSHVEPFSAVVSFKQKDFLHHKNIRTTIRVLEVEANGGVKSLTYKHHNLLNPQFNLSLHKYVETLLAGANKTLDGSIAINSHEKGKTILSPDRALLLLSQENILNLNILVVPKEWEEISVSFVRFDDEQQKQKLIKEQFWLPVANPEHWRLALAFQIAFQASDNLLNKYYNSAQYVPIENEVMDFHGKKVFKTSLAPYQGPNRIASLKIHLNPEIEELYHSEVDNFRKQIDRIFEGNNVLQVAINLKNTLLTIDQKRFSNIHETTMKRLGFVLSQNLESLNKRFIEYINFKKMDKLLEIHNSYSELVEQMPPVCGTRNIANFEAIKERQSADIQAICTKLEREAIPREQQPFTFNDFYDFISQLKCTKSTSQTIQELWQQIWNEYNLTAEQKNYLLNELTELPVVDNSEDFSDLANKLSDFRGS